MKVELTPPLMLSLDYDPRMWPRDQTLETAADVVSQSAT